jgi:hypothetical protein
MVAGLVRPNYLAAVIAHLLADPDVSALCSQGVAAGNPARIASDFPESSNARYRWAMPAYAVVATPAGGPAPDLDIGVRYGRFDLKCFGPGKTQSQRKRLAWQLWATVDPVLLPPQDSGISSSFHAASTIVQQIYAESEPRYLREPGTDWNYVLCPYVVMYMGLRVAA